MTDDQLPWIEIAGRVLAGEYEHADESLRESLRVGMRNVNHEKCRKAMERLAEE